MKPEAILILFEPDKLYRNRKYFLKAGNNSLGSGPNCNIQIKDDPSLPQIAAVFRLNNSLLTLSRPSNDISIKVPSNLVATERVELEKGVQYVLDPQKEFRVGKWRGLVKGLEPGEDWSVIGDIVNRVQFLERLAPLSQSQKPIGSAQRQQTHSPGQPKPQQNANQPNQRQAALSQTLLVQEQQFVPTLILPDQLQLEPTLLIPTLIQAVLEQPESAEHNNAQPQLPKTLEYDEFNISNINLPSTLQQGQQIPQAMMLSKNSVLSHAVTANRMPAQPHTALVSSQPVHTQPQIKTTKSLARIPSIPQESENHKSSEASKAVQMKKQKTKSEIEDMFNDLIEVSHSRTELFESVNFPKTSLDKREPLIEPTGLIKKMESKKSVDSSNQNNKPNGGQPAINHSQHSSSQINSSKCSEQRSLQPNSVESPRKVQQSSLSANSNNDMRQRNSGIKQEKKVSCTGFKPSEIQKIIIRGMKLKLIEEAEQDFDILLVPEEPKITVRLLKALLLKKQIKSLSFINKGSGKIHGRIFGQFWDTLLVKERGNLFSDIRQTQH